MSFERQLNSIWDKEAVEWRYHIDFFGFLWPEIREYITTSVEESVRTIPENSWILDLGSGSGNSEYFNNTDKNRIISLDGSLEMLRNNDFSSKKVQALLPHLPFLNESFSLCTSFFVMRYIPPSDHELLIQNIKRVLTPGGRFLIVDMNQINSYDGQFEAFEAKKTAELVKSTGAIVDTCFEKNLSYGFHSGYGGGSSISCSLNVLAGRMSNMR